ncbi:hypothetical protein [Thalassobacillus hwangdonensis]
MFSFFQAQLTHHLLDIRINRYLDVIDGFDSIIFFWPIQGQS